MRMIKIGNPNFCIELAMMVIERELLCTSNAPKNDEAILLKNSCEFEYYVYMNYPLKIIESCHALFCPSLDLTICC